MLGLIDVNDFFYLHVCIFVHQMKDPHTNAILGLQSIGFKASSSEVKRQQ